MTGTFAAKAGARKLNVFTEPGATTLIPEPSAVITLSCHRLTVDYVSTRRPLESHSFNSLRFHRGWCPARDCRAPQILEDPMFRQILLFAVKVCGSMLLFFMLSMIGLLLMMAAVLGRAH